jgi:hypothetical protein
MMNDDSHSIWIVLQYPPEHPDCFVAQRYQVERPTGEKLIAPTLEGVRKKMPPGLTICARLPSDDHRLVETWF